jgi:peptidyl-prolyl cis-trans isomerase B (cyclophilin B)
LNLLFLTILVVIIAVVVIVVVSVSNKRKQLDPSSLAEPPSTIPLHPYPHSNTLAIVAFVLSFFASVPAIVCGHIALSQIKRTRESGWGLAVAALILGYIGVLAGIIGVVVALSLHR